MLNKLKVILLVGVVLQVLRVFVPTLPMPEDFETQIASLVDVLFVIIPVFVGWFTKESAEQVENLTLSTGGK